MRKGMGQRGGRRSTTFSPTWKHGKTRTIRVPIDLADKGLELIRALDEGHSVGATQAKDEEIRQLKKSLSELLVACLQMKEQLDSKKMDQGEVILTALNRYIEAQQNSSGGNQHRRKGEPLDIDKVRDWKHFVRFMREVEKDS